MPLRPPLARQAFRRRVVEAALDDARRWIDAGISGAISLEEATTEAQLALVPALRETCRAALS